MKITRIFSDKQGETHFEDIEVELESVDYAPPAPPFMVSELRPATHYIFAVAPSGWFGDWHPTPRRQINLYLSGEVEVRVSDGEIRRFGAGSIVLVEDTTGKGHVSRVVSSSENVVAMIHLSN
jgi:hypothetical protein